MGNQFTKEKDSPEGEPLATTVPFGETASKLAAEKLTTTDEAPATKCRSIQDPLSTENVPVDVSDSYHSITTSTADTLTTAATTLKDQVTTPTTQGAMPEKQAVCYIEVSRKEWIWQEPWKYSSQQRLKGSGFVIKHDDHKFIATNAHVVESAIDIRVRRHGMTRRFRAHTVVYAPDVDFALLQVKGDEADVQAFFGEVTPLDFAPELPALQERVRVLGFPTGGQSLCITEGVVSRIDTCEIFLSPHPVLVIQIDAAINAGNSGGPVFDSLGRVAGVAAAKNKQHDMDNIGYVLPAATVQSLLGRCQRRIATNDGMASYTYAFAPTVPYYWHALENKSLRSYHKVPDQIHGILIKSASETLQGALQPNDILTHIDGYAVADDGQVVLRGDDELIHHRYLLQEKASNETVVFTILRDSKTITTSPCSLAYIPGICARWPNVDHMPSYVILGAFVFLPLSRSIFRFSRADPNLKLSRLLWNSRWKKDWEGKEELVFLSQILSHDLSFSYERPWCRATTYNDIPIKSLAHLADLWEASCEQAKKMSVFAVIALEHDDDIVVDVQEAVKAQEEILQLHQIPKASQLVPRNPDYRFH